MTDNDVDKAGPRSFSVTVPEMAAGERADRFLASALAETAPGLSRSRLKALIEEGAVAFGGATLKDPSQRVKPGQVFAIIVPEPRPPEPEGQDIPLEVVYEDADLIVINKPAGLVVHPAPGNPDRTLVNALIAHCGASLQGVGGVGRPGIVHRLDKDTSGLLVAAKNDLAHQDLTRQFQARTIERKYLALVWGVPKPAQGSIEGPIGRDPRNRQRMAVVGKGGKEALTHYKVARTMLGGALSLIECRLATGRTHQIRVHLAAKGHPLIGDPLYGRITRARLGALPPPAREAVGGFQRQALHAASLGFHHPRSKVWLFFEAAMPPDQQCLMEKLGET